MGEESLIRYIPLQLSLTPPNGGRYVSNLKQIDLEDINEMSGEDGYIGIATKGGDESSQLHHGQETLTSGEDI